MPGQLFAWDTHWVIILQALPSEPNTWLMTIMLWQDYGCYFYHVTEPHTLHVTQSFDSPYVAVTIRICDNSFQIPRKLESGYRLPPPPGCPRMLYELMMQCWLVQPNWTCIPYIPDSCLPSLQAPRSIHETRAKVNSESSGEEAWGDYVNSQRRRVC